MPRCSFESKKTSEMDSTWLVWFMYVVGLYLYSGVIYFDVSSCAGGGGLPGGPILPGFPWVLLSLRCSTCAEVHLLVPIFWILLSWSHHRGFVNQTHGSDHSSGLQGVCRCKTPLCCWSVLRRTQPTCVVLPCHVGSCLDEQMLSLQKLVNCQCGVSGGGVARGESWTCAQAVVNWNVHTVCLFNVGDESIEEVGRCHAGVM